MTYSHAFSDSLEGLPTIKRLDRQILEVWGQGRWKAVIGPKLKARSFENQKTEVKIGVTILNKMTELGRPVFEQIA